MAANEEELPGSGRTNEEGDGFSLAKADNYEDPLGPKYEGQYAGQPPDFDGELVVVTYNIKEGEEVDLASEALKSTAALKEADIILLQEMDESGVDQIAQALGHNYVYYPAFVSRDGRNVGNAILAQRPLRDSGKIILPGVNPLSGQKRIAVRATIDYGGHDLRLYSVHTETYASLPGMRINQIEAIVDDIGPGDSLVIAGGDFNTVSGRSIRRMSDQFAAAGLSRVSSGSGPTISKLNFSPVAADHLFTRGFKKIASGAVKEVQASDHFPLWAKVALEKKYWSKRDMSEQSLFVVVYDGRETADDVYDVLRDLEKAKKIDIKTAATVTRAEGGKLNLHQKRFLTGGKGAVGGSIIGLLLAGTGVGVLAGAAIGAAFGARGRSDREELKAFLADKMGPDDSALAILVNDADWLAVQEAVEPYGGEQLAVELSPEAQAELEALVEDKDVIDAVAESVDTEAGSDEQA